MLSILVAYVVTSKLMRTSGLRHITLLKPCQSPKIYEARKRGANLLGSSFGNAPILMRPNRGCLEWVGRGWQEAPVAAVINPVH